jgi:DNA polymerase III epsilon subunit-like protein
MREIVFDTETTGLDPVTGDRLVEIGCIEMVNRFPTGKTFHCYFNPERDMPAAALQVHGLTIEFLKDKPLFVHKVDELIAFLAAAAMAGVNAVANMLVRARPRPLQPRVSADEREAHRGFIATLGELAVWRKYRSEEA